MSGRGEAPGFGALVGRSAELAALERTVAEGMRTALVVTLAGEPGIGKTRLLRELGLRARDEGALVLNGRAAEFDQGAPFAVLHDALWESVDGVGPRRLEALGTEHRAELARIFPGLEAPDAPTSTLQGERHRTHAALRALLDTLAVQRPVLLALDDVHWADDASLEAIAYLLHRPPTRAVTIALAFRSAQQPGLLATGLAAARADGRLHALELGPLSERDAEALLPGLPEEARRAAYAECGGNPFYLQQYARAARAAPHSSGATLEGVPQLVMDAIEAELDQLDEVARAFASGGAVLGETFDVELAARTAGLDGPARVEALNAVARVGLIQPTDSPRRFRFRHPIVRRAIYEATPPGWRLEAHARAAAALSDDGADPLARARHIEASASVGDERAIADLRAAAERAAPRAPAAAARWYEAALRLLPAEDSRRLELRIAVATALGSAGKVAAARDALNAVLAELPPERASLRFRVIPFIAFLEHLLGSHDAATSLLTRALREVPPDAPRDAALLRLELAGDRFYMNDDALADRAREALEAAEGIGDELLAAEARALLALGEYRLGDIAAADRHYEEAAAVIDAADDLALAPRLIALFWLGWYDRCGERHAAGVRHMDRLLSISRLTGQGHLLVPAMIGKAICIAALGRLGAASELSDEAVDMARLSGNHQSLAWALTVRCWIATTSGDLRLAVRCGEEAVKVTQRITESYFSRLASCFLGEALVEAGEPERARDAVLLATGPELEPLEHAFRPHVYEVLAQAEIALGDVDAAREWAERACADVEDIDLPGRTGEALRARAAVELAAGDAAAALATALEAAASFESREQPVDAARARVVAGRAAALAGDRERAANLLRDARRLLLAGGAVRHADAAARALRDLGHRVPRRGSPAPGDQGIDALSGREREIAQLVAVGMTNREIAAALHISEKTVESHLARIFRKLGVARRAQLSAAIAERGVRAS
ncbi:MAG TPA: AAA family ATPase [Solirubrobacterales bacterium]|jgi:ATP/maltotriose-dependent transcriptional regulator MalT